MYKYIIVDDEQPIQRGIKKKLESLDSVIEFVGYAFNGNEALELIESENPDIIITDMNMPILGGKQLLSILSNKYSDKQIIVISGYKDFDYLHNAIKAGVIDYILKPFGKEDIINAVNKAIKKLEKANPVQADKNDSEEYNYNNDIRIIRNIIYNLPIEQPIMHSNKLFHINSANSLMLITIHSSEKLPEKFIRSFIKRNEFGNYVLFLQHESNPNINFFIIFIPDNSPINYQRFSLQIINSLKENYETSANKLIFGISNIHNNIKELHMAFEETVDAMNCRKLSDYESIYRYPHKINSATPISWDKESEFFFRLETGNKQTINELMDELFDYIENSDFNLFQIKYFFINMFEKSREIMMQYFKNVHSISLSHSTQVVFYTMFTMKEFKEYYVQFFNNMTDALENHNIYSNEEDIVDRMKLYIKKNFKNNISIELLSNLFYINRSYCSSIFKERTGQKFVDYLNNVRIENAKTLLKKTDKKISNIAKESGYSNVKYFYRVFKKTTNVTPETYRNNR